MVSGNVVDPPEIILHKRCVIVQQHVIDKCVWPKVPINIVLDIYWTLILVMSEHWKIASSWMIEIFTIDSPFVFIEINYKGFVNSIFFIIDTHL